MTRPNYEQLIALGKLESEMEASLQDYKLSKADNDFIEYMGKKIAYGKALRYLNTRSNEYQQYLLRVSL